MSRGRRLIYAAICIAVVFGFFGLVLYTGGTKETKPAVIDTDIPTWLLFIPFMLVITFFGERAALWIQKKVGLDNSEDED